MAVPDLQFIPAAGGPPIYLELLGHWRKRSAEAYLRRLARHGPARYLVAISEKLCVDPEVAEIRTRRRPIWFKNVLLPRQVLRALEQLE